jgi:hypothetical protein
MQLGPHRTEVPESTLPLRQEPANDQTRSHRLPGRRNMIWTEDDNYQRTNNPERISY